MKRYQYILWDMDGTIINSYEGVTKSVQYAAEHLGVSIEGEERLRPFIGPPLRYSFPRYLGFDAAQTREALKIYRERYDRIGLFECSVYPDIPDVLDEFRRKGLFQVVASSKPELMCRRILRKFGMTGCFDEIVGATMDGRIDTKKEVLEEAFRRITVLDPKFQKRNAVLIGDTRFDAAGAKEEGIDCIGVAYGFGSREELLEHGAEGIAEAPVELKKMIEGASD